MKYILLFAGVILFLLTANLQSQTNNDILNLLIQRNVITQEEADSLRSDDAIKQQEANSKKKSFPVTAGKALQISGFAHLRYRNLDEAGKVDGFDIRRARLDFKGKISSFWSYRLQTDFAPAPKIIDIYAELKLNDYFNFTFGQQKIPFSIENLNSPVRLEAIDWSQAADAFTNRDKDVIGNQNGRDIGITASGTILTLNDKPVIGYQLGIFNGAGINVTDNNESKDVVVRLTLRPFQGLDLGGSYLNGVGKFGTPAKNKGREHWGVEINYVWNNLSLRSEYIHGNDASINREGYYLQGAYYILPQKVQGVFRYDVYDKNLDVAGDQSVLYYAGLNYSINSTTRIQAGYTFREEQGTAVNNNYGVIQLQFGF